jgi:hypothetical protein
MRGQTIGWAQASGYSGEWREQTIQDPWCRFPDGLGYTLDLTGRCKDF